MCKVLSIPTESEIKPEKISEKKLLLIYTSLWNHLVITKNYSSFFHPPDEVNRHQNTQAFIKGIPKKHIQVG